MTVAELAARIDHTMLKPEMSADDAARAADEAAAAGCASVCLPPAYITLSAGRLRPKSDRPTVPAAGGGLIGGPAVCAVVGFPHGTSTPTVKAIEATAALKDGADEVDVVAFLPHLIARDVPAARAELQEIVRAARATRPDAVVKVIVESAVLLASDAGRADPEGMIADACRAVREGGADFIKTSTGFHPAGGASVEAVGWMRKHAGGLKVKASGGLRDLAAVRRMIDAGADRLGLSGTLAILVELAREQGGVVDGNPVVTPTDY